MLSLPDFKEKQVLFVRAERGAENKLKFWNDNLRFTKDGKAVDQISCHKLLAVFVLGDLSVTSVVLKKSKHYGISLHFLDHRFNDYASINAQTEGHYLLRQKQYEFPQEREFAFARHLVGNKICNQAALLKEIDQQDGMKPESLKAAIERCTDSQELLGIEGGASKQFFDHYFGSLGWKRRLPRTKFDPLNTTLDIGYYYLFNFCDALLRLYGFDTYKGIYHKLFFQRRSLACDVMEPFRCVIDRQVRKSFNLGQFKITDFYERNHQFVLRYDQSTRYGQVFNEAILAQNEAIYSYVRQLYKCFLDNLDDWPTFEFERRSQ